MADQLTAAQLAQWLDAHIGEAGSEKYEFIKSKFIEAVEQERESEPKTTLGGIAGSFTRGLAPAAGAAATGAVAGTALGIGPVAGAAAGLGAQFLTQAIGDPLVNTINYATGSNLSTSHEAVKKMLDMAGVKDSDTATERFFKSLGENVGTVAGGIGLGQSIARGAQSAVGRGTGRALAGQQAQQLASAAGASVAGGVSEAVDDNSFIRAGAEILGGALGSGLTGISRRVAAPASAADLAKRAELQTQVKAAREFDADLMTRNLFKARTDVGQSIQGMSDKLPGGPSSQLKRLAIKRETAVNDALSQFSVFGSDIDDITANLSNKLVENRGRIVRKHVMRKRDVVERLSSESDPVPTPKFEEFILSEIERLSKGGEVAQGKLMQTLSDFADMVRGRSLEGIELNRATIGELLKGDPNLASIQDSASKIMRKAYGRLVGDMEDYIKRKGGARDLNTFKDANAKLRGLVNELDSTVFKSAIKSDDINPSALGKKLFSPSATKEDVQRFYKNMTARQQVRTRGVLLAHAYDKTQKLKNPTPGAFLAEVKKLRRQTGIFFEGVDNQRLKSLKRFLESTSEADTFLPKTGDRLTQLGVTAATGAATGSIWATIGGLLTGAKLFKFVESPAVRDLLIKTARARPASAEEGQLFKRLSVALNDIIESGEEFAE